MSIFSNYRGYYKILGLRGILHAMQEKFVNGPKEINVSPSGVKLPITLRLNTSDIPTYKQVFLDEEYKFKPSYAPSMIIDAGANIGLSSIYFSNIYPHAKIIAMEPENSNFALLEKNIKGYPNIIPVRAALWGENSTVEVVDPGLGKYGFQTKECNEIKSDLVLNKIQGITVSMLLKEYEVEKIDILKIDIEGAEKEVFENSEEWIDKIEVLIVELHDHLKAGCSRSFYNATNNYSVEWHQGELVFLAREGAVADKI